MADPVSEPPSWMAPWLGLTRLPAGELRRRAAIVEEIAADEGLLTPVPVPGAEHFGWADGSGQETHWFFHPDGKILLTTFDHECALNVYPDYDYEQQRSLLDGVPEPLCAPLLDLPGDGPLLTIAAADGRTVLTVGGVFFLDPASADRPGEWQVAQGVLDFCAARGLDVFLEAGFAWCVSDYHLDGDCTVEAMLAERRLRGYYDGDFADEAADRRRLTRLFDRAERRLG
ncbi:hypothetical protein [Gordonia hirsuta]|uniref:hypothetical protein n=1 Tax=Gordonia hirsuta TaxID=53427 RepID=UPI000346C1E1|nr:hypothetical protein [Gordonia hirsuta]